jgi:MoxR-like ATPase
MDIVAEKTENKRMQSNTSDVQLVKELNQKYSDLKKEIAKVIVGQESIIEQIFIAILSQGHCMLIGVPGLAKTLIVKTLSDVLDLKFNRIQFTPDLMPSDITGMEILESTREGEKTFKFIQGPIFANLLLADEINRTPPKTQSALLEAMQEHKVTAAGVTYTLDEPFFVLATQNPIEHEGTYPLPEAQLDRFMFDIRLDYPTAEQEIEIVQKTTSSYIPQVKHIFSREEIIKFQQLIKKVPVADDVIRYTVNQVGKTRPGNPDSPDFMKKYISWGAGPRASQYLILGAKTVAVLDGRYSPSIDDVKKVSKPVLRHRLIANFNAEADGINVLDLIDRLFT